MEVVLLRCLRPACVAIVPNCLHETLMFHCSQYRRSSCLLNQACLYRFSKKRSETWAGLPGCLSIQ